MLAEFAAPVLLFLLLLHALVGYVELGTDSWITNIMSGFIRKQRAAVGVYGGPDVCAAILRRPDRRADQSARPAVRQCACSAASACS